MDYLVIGIIVSLLVLIIAIVIRNAIIDNKIMHNSQRITDLLRLNDEISFNEADTKFTISKRYDNKSNYNKVEPAYLITAEIKSNVEFFSKYISNIKENRSKQIIYQEQINCISAKEYDINYSELKIPEKTYKKREKKLFSKYVISPTVDCSFEAIMYYSSPKGRVNLSKNQILNFDDVFACFESVSRSHLDKSTYSKLVAVERGEISDSLRYDILNRDNFTCTICGASAKQGARLHVDHIIPVSKGGKSTPDNLRTLCERCNIGKSNKIETATAKIEPSYNEELICKQCGGELVLRKGKYGDFYGCVNYPNCRFTKKL